MRIPLFYRVSIFLKFSGPFVFSLPQKKTGFQISTTASNISFFLVFRLHFSLGESRSIHFSSHKYLYARATVINSQ